MGIRLEMDGGCRGILGGDRSGKLGVVVMTVYTPQQLQALLGIGKVAAYRIMKEYGFRTGYTYKSPLRITEEGVREWVKSQMMTTDSARTQ